MINNPNSDVWLTFRLQMLIRHFACWKVMFDWYSDEPVHSSIVLASCCRLGQSTQVGCSFS